VPGPSILSVWRILQWDAVDGVYKVCERSYVCVAEW
jgi:hypothetical protein